MTDVTNLMHQVPWSLVWLALGGGSAVAVASQLTKRVFKLESEKVIQFLVMALAFMASGLQYVLSAHNIPPTVLGLHTAALLGVAQPLYLFFVKPADKFVQDVQSYNAAQSATGAESNITSSTTSTGSETVSTTGNTVKINPPTANF